MHCARWDRLGLLALSICRIHCLCLPWLLLIMSFLDGLVSANPTADFGLVMTPITLAMICAVTKNRLGSSGWPLILVVIGTWWHQMHKRSMSGGCMFMPITNRA
ncbi:hypothetical protein N8703_04230 [Verrucomicrobia bacterium]|nr:hypothetical protein [Verrucomicrobiota bacterium]